MEWRWHLPEFAYSITDYDERILNIKLICRKCRKREEKASSLFSEYDMLCLAAGSVGQTTITATAAGGITASSTLKVEKIIVNIADTDIRVPYPTYTGGK